MLTIFGRKVSLSVLLNFISAAAATLAGAVVAIHDNWQANPLLALGAAQAAVTTLIHVYDTQFLNPPK